MTLFPRLFSTFLACIPAPCAQSFDSLTNYGALKSAAERESYADKCAAQDEWSIAVAAKDCAKACELAGM